MEQNRNKEKPRRRRVLPCLSCGHSFRPAGPFIRVCQPCKESEEWESGNCDFVLHPANDNDPGK